MPAPSLSRLASLVVVTTLATAGLIASFPTSSSAAPTPAERATRSAPAALPRLHATTGAPAAIRNDRGAQVLLRGINVNGLVEYYQPNPAYAPVTPQTRDDFRSIARLGFNSVRLLVSWSRLQPTRGAYDTAYVKEIRRSVRWAGEFGLYVVLDMHQDAWGLSVDTRSGETCPAGAHPNNGWDGAPAWATMTDGASTCTTDARELAPAVEHAWEHFYDDKAGIQSQLVRTWGRLARDFARDTTVAGFDLLNEPGIGLDLSANGTTDLGRFYARSIRAIRAGERQGRGFSHIVFFEPNVMWSALGQWSTPEPGFTRDRNLVFAPHVYAESLSSNTIREGFDAARTAAEQYGVTVWSGEWGFFPDTPADSAAQVAAYGVAEDAFRYGGAWWVWEQACGNPHVIPEPGGVPGARSPSLVAYSCPSQQAHRVDPAFGDVLTRPTARAVPGRITRLTSSRNGELELAGVRTDGAKRCALRVFLPARSAHAKVRVHGISHLQRRHRQGNVVLRGCVADTFQLRIG
jgi:endoglycosylceramidase